VSEKISVRRPSKVVLGASLGALSILALLVALFFQLRPGSGVSDDFSNDRDGPKTITDSGQVVNLFPSSSPRTPRVKDGWLTFDEVDGVLGGYYIVNVPKVNRATAEVAFTPWSKGGGLFCLAFMEDDIADSSPVVPRSPMHLTMSPTHWSVDVFDEKGAAARTIADGEFLEPLMADGATLHAVAVELDSDAGTVHVTLPDGVDVTVSDPAIKVVANYVYIEPWRTTASADETLAKVRNWSAGSTVAAP
jgi:hypothetical protein